MLQPEDIRQLFYRKYIDNEVEENGTLEIRGVTFEASSEPIFGKRSQKYLKAEIAWYREATRDAHKLFELYGKEVEIWKNCMDNFGEVNSNYGWCIWDDERGSQSLNVLAELEKNPSTRQAVMIYTHPNMHYRGRAFGMHDFTCTNTVQYFIRDGYLETYVHMRSQDAVFGYTYDYPWQSYVASDLRLDLRDRGIKLKAKPIVWSVGSLHVYPRHFNLIKEHYEV